MNKNEFDDDSTLDYHALNAMLNLFGPGNKLQLDADKKAVRKYFLTHVNQNTVFFYNLKEKLNYLVDNEYYDPQVLNAYSEEFVHNLYDVAYAKKFRFPTFMGAFKFFTGYALKNFEGDRYLERYEDRVCMTALALARGNEKLATLLMEEIISGRFQPATPTFLNAGKKQRGELVSCFLLRVEDNMESIGRSVNSALQLSKRGGGVALNLTNLREARAPIKKIKNVSAGLVPVMKMLEDAFSYADQLGARQGAGAVYVHMNHPDILAVLDTKKENADEKIRIKTLSLGIVVPDIAFELARNNDDMYLFSPYDIQRVYGVAMSEISVTEKYYEMVADPQIKKSKVNVRELFQKIAQIQFESGYPYLMFEDTVNRASAIDGRVSMSNLCSEILQVSTPSVFKENLDYEVIGDDISCNLGSMNIAKAMESPNFGKTVEVAIRALTAVSDMSNIDCVPSVAKGNADSHAIGLGQMNLHGYLVKEGIMYGSEESIDFTDIYFMTVAYHAIRSSAVIAKETGVKFAGFEKSKYATGAFFTKYLNNWQPKTEVVRKIFEKNGIAIPTTQDWLQLKEFVKEYGMYHRYIQAVPPTGSISYINNSTSSIHPIAAPIEIRKEGKIGRVYYPAPFLSDENLHLYKDAYEIGPEKVIDVYAAATQHVDQGLSLTLFVKADATTRDINRIQAYAWSKGIKSVYYIRTRQEALTGTEVDGCVSCAL